MSGQFPFCTVLGGFIFPAPGPRQGSFWTNDFHFALVATLLRDKAHFGQIISILHLGSPWLYWPLALLFKQFLFCTGLYGFIPALGRPEFNETGLGQNKNLSNFHFALFSEDLFFSGPGPGQNNNLSNFHFALVSGLFIPAPGPARVQSFNFIVFPIGADGSLRTVLVYLMVIHYMDNRGNSTLPKKMRF